MGVKHEMKAWVKVGKSGRLRYVTEGKAKRTNMEESMQQASLDSLEKGEETTIVEVMKRREGDQGGRTSS